MVSFCSRTGFHELITSTNAHPHPAISIDPNLDVDITWILNNLTESEIPCLNFQIKRDSKKCHTPRRNADVEIAIDHFSSM